MKNKGKGQAAVEYLIILAVVIIIALVVVGVLGGFPALTRGVSERESAVYWAGADIGFARYTSTSGGSPNVTAIIRNNRNFNIKQIDVVTLGGAGNTPNTNNYTGVLAPGQTTAVFFSLGTLADGQCATAGETFSLYPVTFNYQDAQYGTTYTFIGAKALAGTCS